MEVSWRICFTHQYHSDLFFFKSAFCPESPQHVIYSIRPTYCICDILPDHFTNDTNSIFHFEVSRWPHSLRSTQLGKKKKQKQDIVRFYVPSFDPTFQSWRRNMCLYNFPLSFNNTKPVVLFTLHQSQSLEGIFLLERLPWCDTWAM